MPKRKTLWALMLSAVLVGGCLAALAQEKMSAEEAGPRLERLTKELNLTADQQEKLKPIFERESADWRELHKDKSLTQEQRLAKKKEIHEKYVPEINQVLTPEQQEKWKTMKQEAWEKHEHMKGDTKK